MKIRPISTRYHDRPVRLVEIAENETVKGDEVVSFCKGKKLNLLHEGSILDPDEQYLLRKITKRWSVYQILKSKADRIIKVLTLHKAGYEKHEWKELLGVSGNNSFTKCYIITFI